MRAIRSRVLSGLNQALYGKFQVHYVTAAYALIDTAKQTLCYAGAGHPPLLLRDGATGEVREVLENGLFLGYFPNVVYTSIEVPFGKGDWVLLYTDGIPEMSNAADEQFGEAGLKQYLQEHGSVPAAEFASALLKHLSEWSGTASGREPDDDVTLLADSFPARRLACRFLLYPARSYDHFQTLDHPACDTSACPDCIRRVCRDTDQQGRSAEPIRCRYADSERRQSGQDAAPIRRSED